MEKELEQSSKISLNGRNVLNVNDVIDEYNKCKNIHKVAEIFSTSHMRISKLLKDNDVEINNIGKRKDFTEDDISNMICDYVENHLTMENISKKYGIRIKRLRKIFNERNVKISKWNGHVKKEKKIVVNEKKQYEYKKCPYCDWKTKDIDNKSHAYQKHLFKEHDIDIERHLKEFPEDIFYLKNASNKKQLVECKVCGKLLPSKYESNIKEFLKENDITFEEHDRKLLNGLEIDILLDNIGIEFNGNKYHTEWFGKKDKNYHLNKTLECNRQGIKLLQIFEDEFVEHKDIVLNKISHIIGIQQDLPKIMGRKCKIEVIDKEIAESFLNDYHIQGFSRSTVYLGAIYGNILIGVMSFKQNTKGSSEWELTRFASDYHYICQGVGGKLFNWFIRNYNPTEIKSFADRRWTLDKDNNLYTKLGFELVDELKPNYRYYNPKVDKYKRFHKFGFRKEILNKKYGLPLTMSETEMVKSLGYDRIYDCGLFKFVWRKN